MDDRRLAQLEHENLLALFGMAAKRRDGIVRMADGVATIVARVPLRLFNFVVSVDTPAAAPAFGAAIAAIRTEDVAWVAHVRRGVDESLRDVVTEAGLVLEDGPMPGMAVSPIPRFADPPPELVIRRIADEAGFDDHVRVVSASFGMDEAMVRTFLDSSWLDVPGLDVHVGWVDGVPVATSLGYRSGRTLGVYNVATVDSHRRRGYGAALTVAAMAAGAKDGCDTAILQASEMGLPVYEALGFRTVVTYDGYVEPDGVSEAQP